MALEHKLDPGVPVGATTATTFSFQGESQTPRDRAGWSWSPVAGLLPYQAHLRGSHARSLRFPPLFLTSKFQKEQKRKKKKGNGMERKKKIRRVITSCRVVSCRVAPRDRGKEEKGQPITCWGKSREEKKECTVEREGRGVPRTLPVLSSPPPRVSAGAKWPADHNTTRCKLIRTILRSSGGPHVSRQRTGLSRERTVIYHAFI